MKRVMIFDLDETLINSKHRTPSHPDGTLNLEAYLKMKSRETIFKDTLLPLSDFYRQLKTEENYRVICTARVMNQDDFDFLAHHGINSEMVMCRSEDGSENGIKDGILKSRKLRALRFHSQFKDLPFYMWDDSPPVLNAIRKLGIAAFNAIKVNQRLA